MILSASNDPAASTLPASRGSDKADGQPPAPRAGGKVSRRGFLAGVAATALSARPGRVSAQPAAVRPAQPILFTNFRLFDGKASALRDGFRLIVDGGRIKAMTQGGSGAPEGARTIDCGGRTLMPGLIDAHWHSFMAATPQLLLLTSDPSYLYLLATRQAEATLMRGFTTVRDMGGPVFGLKRAIDEGVVVGPRIYPSGAFISQTSGHGDFRSRHEVPRASGGPLSQSELSGVAAIADSADEVRLRAREQLRAGASQIKLMGSGGVSSPFSHIEATEFTEAEIRAAVEAAENWGTYVALHAYTPRAIRQGITAGVKCLEHGHLIDDPTAKLLADKDVWWSLQPLTYDADVFARMSPVSQQKALAVFAGTENAYQLAKKYRVKTAFGADILFDAGAASRQGGYLAMLSRWYTPAEALKMATADNGELMALSGFINPYPSKLGVVEEGAFADLLLVNGNPIERLDLVQNPNENFSIIMKDGIIYKDTINR